MDDDASDNDNVAVKETPREEEDEVQATGEEREQDLL